MPWPAAKQNCCKIHSIFQVIGTFNFGSTGKKTCFWNSLKEESQKTHGWFFEKRKGGLEKPWFRAVFEGERCETAFRKNLAHFLDSQSEEMILMQARASAMVWPQLQGLSHWTEQWKKEDTWIWLFIYLVGMYPLWESLYKSVFVTQPFLDQMFDGNL